LNTVFARLSWSHALNSGLRPFFTSLLLIEARFALFELVCSFIDVEYIV